MKFIKHQNGRKENYSNDNQNYHLIVFKIIMLPYKDMKMNRVTLLTPKQ